MMDLACVHICNKEIDNYWKN